MQKSKPGLRRAKSGKAFYEYMTPRFWRIHYLVPGTIALFSLGLALGIAHFSSFQPYKALATVGDNIRGWAWTPNAGWISLNDQKPHCASPCSSGGTYGINMATTESIQPDGQQGHTINGFAWSDNLGFICFGSSCNIPACRTGGVPNFYAYAEKITDNSPKELHGWAVICNIKEAGWISLNCEDTGACTGANTVFYKLVYNPADNKFHVATVNGSPYGYNGNNDGSGLGYISFTPKDAGGSLSPDGMYLEIPSENTDSMCTDAKDNDLNGQTDCADANCAARPVCTTSELNWLGPALTQQYTACHDSADNNINGKADCAGVGALPADPTCSAAPVCQPEYSFTNGCIDHVDNDGDTAIDCADTDCAARPECTTEFSCTDDADNDGNGLKDCEDPGCLLDPACTPPQPQCVDKPACAGIVDAQERANCCCSDGTPNGQPAIDCMDAQCQAQAPVCAAWTKALGGNIYAGGGITGTKAPQQSGVTNAAFCLRSNATIEWTSPDQYAACKEANVGEIALPTSENRYRSQLGFLDLAGLRTGRYGTVVTVSDSSQVAPANLLGGQIYRYASGGTFTLSAKTFENAIGTSGKGAGTLLVEGADLRITGDISYSPSAVQQRIKNLASFGVIVVKDSSGAGGNVYIDPAVTTVSGAIFAEGEVHTGASNTYLKLFGLFIAKKFDLGRTNNTDPTKPAEEFLFDGRAVVNPPPGMQDAGKSLPRQSDASF